MTTRSLQSALSASTLPKVPSSNGASSATWDRSVGIESMPYRVCQGRIHFFPRNGLQTMICHRPWLRILVPTGFALGLCTSALCLALGSPLGHRRTISAPLHVSETPDKPHLAYTLPFVELMTPVVERKVRCRIHRSEMKSVLVGVEYGLRILDDQREAYMTAKEASFPHCNDAIWVGCMPQSNNEDFKDVCPECNAARDRWLLRHLLTPKH